LSLSRDQLFALSDEEALSLAEERGTPCFVYRVDRASARFKTLRAALPKRARLAYAVKANPHHNLIAAFAREGAYFDCASDGELSRVRAAGLPGSRILFAGPGKSANEIRLAIGLGARIQADGIEDLERIDAALSRMPGAQLPLAVSLRVHPGEGSGVTESNRIIGGAGPSAFGVDEEDLSPFLREARRFESVRIAGLQVFAASNEREADRLLDNHRAAFAIAERMTRDEGLTLDLIDLGGGLGIPYSYDETELDIAALGKGLEKLLRLNDWYEGEIVVEPGRWLVGPVGVYLGRVLRAKRSRGVDFAILEGGVNHLLRPALTGQAFPASAPGVPGEPTIQTLAGPLCTSLDRLGQALLPRLKAGDLVMLGQAGAYGYTEAMTLFLSHEPAAEICL
jgi:diaminopimelate decarboxylase